MRFPHFGCISARKKGEMQVLDDFSIAEKRYNLKKIQTRCVNDSSKIQLVWEDIYLNAKKGKLFTNEVKA